MNESCNRKALHTRLTQLFANEFIIHSKFTRANICLPEPTLGFLQFVPLVVLSVLFRYYPPVFGALPVFGAPPAFAADPGGAPCHRGSADDLIESGKG
jgi:hypothetical protein